MGKTFRRDQEKSYVGKKFGMFSGADREDRQKREELIRERGSRVALFLVSEDQKAREGARGGGAVVCCRKDKEGGYKGEQKKTSLKGRGINCGERGSRQLN